MRKKLEAELMSIAHRILQIKHKDDVRELHHETQKLYEKLSVLLFVEENFNEVRPTIGIHEIEQKLEKAFDFDEKIVVAEIKEEANELIVESKVETPKVEVEAKQEPIKKVVIEEPKVEVPKVEVETPIVEIPKPDKKQISFDDILGSMQPEPIFERISTTEKPKEAKIPVEISKIIEHKIEETEKVLNGLADALRDIFFLQPSA